MEPAMTHTPTQQEEWTRLIESAVRIKQLAPWQWMNEDDVFGITHPETGEIGFISVMGALGQHVAIAVYLGSPAFAKFIALQHAPPDVLDEYPELVLEIPQLQASFEDRDNLENWDRQLLRSLNLKFRGRKAWPRFQSFRPGFMPWRLESDEIAFLTLALEQLEQVAPRVQEDRSLLLGKNPGTFFVRACCSKEGEIGEWEDRHVRIPAPEVPPVPIAWDPRDVEKLKRAVSQGDIIELDFSNTPEPSASKASARRPVTSCSPCMPSPT
jgi:hypothetical protein